MITFLISVLAAMVSGSGWMSAAAAFEHPPVNQTARRYCAAALSLLLIAAALLVAAAIIDSMPNGRAASEAVGWSGLACLEASVICGIRYRFVNRISLSGDSSCPP